MEKKCVVCESVFVGRHYNSITCSDECQTTNDKNKLYLSNQRIKEKKQLANIAKYEHANPNSYVECQICKYRAPTLGSHVKAHGYSSGEQYKKDFPGFFLVSKDRSDAVKGSNNPGYQHGGTLSPFSKKFVAYSHLTENEKETAIEKIADDRSALIEAEPHRNPLRIEYYLHKGMSQAEAEQALTVRQTTFNLDICIEKHGVVEGTRIWQERQDKWQATLNSKPQDEIDEMNRKKTTLHNYAKFMNSDSPGTFYILQLPNDTIKIGITSKNLKERFNVSHMVGVQVLYEFSHDLRICYQIESILKERYVQNHIKKEEQLHEFGYTETFRGIDPSEIISYVENASIKDIESTFIEVYENFTKKEFIARLDR